MKAIITSESEESQEPIQSFPQVSIPKIGKQLRVSVINNIGRSHNN